MDMATWHSATWGRKEDWFSSPNRGLPPCVPTGHLRAHALLDHPDIDGFVAPYPYFLSSRNPAGSMWPSGQVSQPIGREPVCTSPLASYYPCPPTKKGRRGSIEYTQACYKY